MSLSRSNYFHNQGGENNNIAPVIYSSSVPSSSIGFSEGAFFSNLGHEYNKVGSNARNAEQEYLLQGMPKGAMHEAAAIANRFNIGISVRPTGVLAHMGIESGDPTKAQEFKNKTSKELDIFLCDEISWVNVGSVVHYNPRVGWRSNNVRNRLMAYYYSKSPAVPTEAEWAQKKRHIESRMTTTLAALRKQLSFWPQTPADWNKLKALFIDRAKEYDAEDYDYRFGHYQAHTQLVGPYIRLKLRAGVNIVGDHDLFGFTNTSGKLVHDKDFGIVQEALQAAPSFQAQHGGIWNWEPREAFHQSIKVKIMGAHSAPNGDPLILILPGFIVLAAFYVPGKEVLESVWSHPEAHNWYMQTFSGKKMNQM